MRTKPSSRALPGRPRTSELGRAEQLRMAKRAQRERDAKAGRREARLRLPRELAERLNFAAAQPGFNHALEGFLGTQVIEVKRYPQLALLCWNRQGRLLSPRDSWSLYERNWRFIERDALDDGERALIEQLSSRFGVIGRHV